MENETPGREERPSRVKFIIGGVLIFAAIVYLIISSAQANTQYFLTVEELNQKGKNMLGRDVRVSGVVLGDSIQYDAEKFELSFVVAHIPGDNSEIEAQGGIAEVLQRAAKDETLPRLQVVYYGVKPDLMKDEAQAIMTGKLGEDGVFYVDELLMKCPTKYEDAVPEQVQS